MIFTEQETETLIVGLLKSGPKTETQIEDYIKSCREARVSGAVLELLLQGSVVADFREGKLLVSNNPNKQEDK